METKQTTRVTAESASDRISVELASRRTGIKPVQLNEAIVGSRARSLLRAHIIRQRFRDQFDNFGSS